MTFGGLGALSFASPWILAGLAALPVIWWLLQFTPPRPQTVPFPPASLLLGLRAREKTPVRSPWWLTLLRILVATGVIAALAGPVLKPPSSGALALSRPLLVVVDNGWGAGSRWQSRRSFADQLASLAEVGGQQLYLAATAGPSVPLQPLTPPEFKQHFASLAPQPYPGDRAALAQKIEKELGAQRGKISIAWLADGIEDPGADSLRKTLAEFAGGEKVDIFDDSAGAGALAITRPAFDGGGAIKARPTHRASCRRHRPGRPARDRSLQYQRPDWFQRCHP